MVHLFSFSYNTETKEAAVSGNIGIQEALNLLQQLMIADAVAKAKQEVLTANKEDAKLDDGKCASQS